MDSVFQLKEIWPKIKKQLPKAELHIYGSLCAAENTSTYIIKRKVLCIKGWAADVETVMKNYRVQLAPLRFGAGLKGKLLDAMRFGLPTVTTVIGAEGMSGKLPFGGTITSLKEEFIIASLKLYSEENLWNNAQQNSFKIIEKRFQKKLFSEDFKKQISILSKNLERTPTGKFHGQILQHHTLLSTKYLSKWIESKNFP